MIVIVSALVFATVLTALAVGARIYADKHVPPHDDRETTVNLGKLFSEHPSVVGGDHPGKLDEIERQNKEILRRLKVLGASQRKPHVTAAPLPPKRFAGNPTGLTIEQAEEMIAKEFSGRQVVENIPYTSSGGAQFLSRKKKLLSRKRRVTTETSRKK